MLARLKWSLSLSGMRAGSNSVYGFCQKQQKPQQPNSTLKPKLFKLSRNKPTDAHIQPSKPEYKGEEQYLTKAESAYYMNVEEKLAQNVATHNFYAYEMNRGEDLIDRVPVDPYYEYKLGDIKLETEHRQRMIDNLQGIKSFADPNRYEKLKSIVTGYQTMKHRYEYEQFVRKLEQYPGSVKGPLPEDDPTVFIDYVRKIAPEWVLAQLKMKRDELGGTSKVSTTTTYMQTQIEQQDEEQHDQQQPPVVLGSDLVTDKLTNQPQFLQDKDIENQDFEMIAQNWDPELAGKHVRYRPVPLLPRIHFDEYHSYMCKLVMWSQFRKYWATVNQLKEIRKSEKAMEDMLEQNHQRLGIRLEVDQKKEQQKEQLRQRLKKKDPKKIKKRDIRKLESKNYIASCEIKPKAYSLYTYYKTLPKQIQQHPGVRTTYLGLEYSQPDVTYEQKEQTLNQAAKMSLPMDTFSNAVMDQITAKPPIYLTPHLTDRIYNMSPQYTWDIHQFLQEVKDQKLRSISTVKEKQENYIDPPEKTKEQDTDLANLPVDFYDNEDGFWDDYIDQKLQRYQKVQPLSEKPKKHFIH